MPLTIRAGQQETNEQFIFHSNMETELCPICKRKSPKHISLIQTRHTKYQHGNLINRLKPNKYKVSGYQLERLALCQVMADTAQCIAIGRIKRKLDGCAAVAI